MLIGNERKAFYRIFLPKTGKSTAEDVNETRLNDNFKTIGDEFRKLWDFIKDGFSTKSMTVDGDLDVTGNTSIGGDATVSGGVSASTVTASGNASVGGDASVTGGVSAATLSSSGDATVGGNLSVTGNTTVANETVGGVLTVTNRIAEAVLSSAGWYRVLTFAGTDQYDPLGLTGALMRFNIERYGNTGSNGNHQIDLSWAYNHREFVNELSNGADVLVDKIRATTKGNEFYVDIHFAGTSAHRVTVDFDVKSFTARRSLFTTNGLAAVDDAPSGETVVKQYSFHANGAHIGDLHIDDDFGATLNNALVVNANSNINGNLLLLNSLEIISGDIRLTSGNIYTGGELLLPFLTKGTAIPSNADMNTYTAPGVYYATTAVASTLTNANITTVGFKLIVMPMTGSDLMQIHMADWDNCIIAMRRYNGSTWSGYRRITPVSV